MSALYSESVASGKTSFDLSALSASAASVGGLDSASASILFSGSSSGSGGISSAALNLNATLALASYSNYLNGVPTGTKAATTTNSTQPTDIQAAIQTAQSTALSSMLNLLA
jgi:hypothetical protein